MTPLIVALPGNEALADALARSGNGHHGLLETRHFPDGESYIRFADDPHDRVVILVCTLSRPNDKILDLLFTAATARDLGATKVGLVAPYLAYMRQDRRFNRGEAITSKEIGRLISEAFDWLVTVDPHLHRYGSLAEIYSIPAQVVHAAPMIAAWIRTNITDPILIGPDRESEQWVSAVAADAGAPFTVLEKVRHGDREVDISIRDVEALHGRSPVLIDDIISSGRTMLEAVRLISSVFGQKQPVCIAVHALFADEADQALVSARARVVTCNTVLHGTNAIDVWPSLAQAIQPLTAGH
jgi:ribose-phosphate pyrophosphokinase